MIVGCAKNLKGYWVCHAVQYLQYIKGEVVSYEHPYYQQSPPVRQDILSLP